MKLILSKDKNGVLFLTGYNNSSKTQSYMFKNGDGFIKYVNNVEPGKWFYISESDSVFICGGKLDNDISTDIIQHYSYSKNDIIERKMNTKRHGHTATLLPNGNIFIAGGIDENNTHLKSYEIHNILTGEITTGDMEHHRAFHRATLLHDGNVLLTGGNTNKFIEDHDDHRSLEIIHPYDDNEPKRVKYLHHPYISHGHTATLLENGNVVIIGGNRYVETRFLTITYTTSPIHIYNVKNNSLERKGLTHLKRYNHTATLLGNGKILIIGGRNHNDANISLKTSEVYNPYDNSIRSFVHQESYQNHTSTMLDSKEILVMSAYENYNAAPLYFRNYRSYSIWNIWFVSRSNSKVYVPNTSFIHLYEREWDRYPTKEIEIILHDAVGLRDRRIFIYKYESKYAYIYSHRNVPKLKISEVDMKYSRRETASCNTITDMVVNHNKNTLQYRYADGSSWLESVYSSGLNITIYKNDDYKGTTTSLMGYSLNNNQQIDLDTRRLNNWDGTSYELFKPQIEIVAASLGYNHKYIYIGNTLDKDIYVRLNDSSYKIDKGKYIHMYSTPTRSDKSKQNRTDYDHAFQGEPQIAHQIHINIMRKMINDKFTIGYEGRDYTYSVHYETKDGGKICPYHQYNYNSRVRIPWNGTGNNIHFQKYIPEANSLVMNNSPVIAIGNNTLSDMVATIRPLKPFRSLSLDTSLVKANEIEISLDPGRYAVIHHNDIKGEREDTQILPGLPSYRLKLSSEEMKYLVEQGFTLTYNDNTTLIEGIEQSLYTQLNVNSGIRYDWNGTLKELAFNDVYDRTTSDNITLSAITPSNSSSLLAIFKNNTETDYDPVILNVNRHQYFIDIMMFNNWGYFTDDNEFILNCRDIEPFNNNPKISVISKEDMEYIIKGGKFLIDYGDVQVVYNDLDCSPGEQHKSESGVDNISSWNGCSNDFDLYRICLISTSKILTPSGEKEIKTLERGDEVITEHGILKIARVICTPLPSPLVIIKKDAIFNTYNTPHDKPRMIPTDDVISTDSHTFWLDNIPSSRYKAKDLVDMNYASYLHDHDHKKVYNLQFEIETSFFVSGLLSDSVSPYLKGMRLPKDLYFNTDLYHCGRESDLEQYRFSSIK